jgi:hypothetical protein
MVLEFDHLDRAAKEFTMGFMATRGYAWPTVQAELAKCEVRCANCHRHRTAVQFEWPKLGISTRTPSKLAMTRTDARGPAVA